MVLFKDLVIFLILVTQYSCVAGRNKHHQECGACGDDNTSCHVIRGIYTRASLPYGYNKITTIPKGACQINITETHRSSNYLALKLSDGDYILNGDWALGYSNDYKGAGTVFKYHRPLPRDLEGRPEHILADGPTTTTVDIMLLKQQEKTGIKYSYSIPRTKYSYHKGTQKRALQHASKPHVPRYVSKHDYTSQVAAQQNGQMDTELPQRDDRTRYEEHYQAYLQRLRKHREQQARLRGTQMSESTQHQPNQQLAGTTYEERLKAHRQKQEERRQQQQQQLPSETAQGLLVGSQQLQTPARVVPTVQSLPQPGINYGIPQNPSLIANSANIAKVPLVIPNSNNPRGTGSLQNPSYGYQRGLPQSSLQNYPYQGQYPSGVYSGPPSSGGQQPQYIPNAYGQPPYQQQYYGQHYYNTQNNQYFGRPGNVQTPEQAINDQIPLALLGNNPYPQIGLVDATGDYSWKITGFTECSRTCGEGQQETIVVCVKVSSLAIVTDDNCRNSVRPQTTTFTCNTDICPPGWEPDLWGPCSKSCDRGQQTRQVTCKQRISAILQNSVSATLCLAQPKPRAIQSCNEDNPCIKWRVAEWSKCSAECGRGQRTRVVTCVNALGDALPDTACTQHKPTSVDICDMGSCAKTWFYSDWSTECSSECGPGVVTRDVHCAADHCKVSDKPASQKACRSDVPCGGTWFTGPWTKCTVTCGQGVIQRDVVCMKKLARLMAVVDDYNCNTRPKPESEQLCQRGPCKPQWYFTNWTQCTKSCNAGLHTREVKCLDENQLTTSSCNSAKKPVHRQTCNPLPCPISQPDPGCTDSFRNCLLVVQARLCSYDYYKTNCCLSCLSHH